MIDPIHIHICITISTNIQQNKNKEHTSHNSDYDCPKINVHAFNSRYCPLA